MLIGCAGFLPVSSAGIPGAAYLRWSASYRRGEAANRKIEEKMKRLVLAAVILTGIVIPAYGQDTRPLFVIERNVSKNVVHYDAQLTTEGSLDPKEPVIAYWAMMANGGHREELTFLERLLGYGFTIQPDPNGRGFRMALVADRERKITVSQKGDQVAAEIMIAGRPALLRKVHVNLTEGFGFPKVNYFELFGRDPTSGEDLYEKIMPK
jgi:hypothetical protein